MYELSNKGHHNSVIYMLWLWFLYININLSQFQFLQQFRMFDQFLQQFRIFDQFLQQLRICFISETRVHEWGIHVHLCNFAISFILLPLSKLGKQKERIQLKTMNSHTKKRDKKSQTLFIISLYINSFGKTHSFNLDV